MPVGVLAPLRYPAGKASNTDSPGFRALLLVGVVYSSDLYIRSLSAAPASDMEREVLRSTAAVDVVAGSLLLGIAAAGGAIPELLLLLT